MAEEQSEHPQHVREAGETIHELREERHRELPKPERIVQDLSAWIGRPAMFGCVVAAIVVWVVLNLVLRPQHRAFDTDTFALLNTAAQLFSLVIVLMVLSAQNSQRTLEEERARLTLQLSLIIDKKITHALRQAGGPAVKEELHEPTDLHQAAEALREAEQSSQQ
jgi:uncharacterized membrane protein